MNAVPYVLVQVTLDRLDEKPCDLVTFIADDDREDTNVPYRN